MRYRPRAARRQWFLQRWGGGGTEIGTRRGRSRGETQAGWRRGGAAERSKVGRRKRWALGNVKLGATRLAGEVRRLLKPQCRPLLLGHISRHSKPHLFPLGFAVEQRLSHAPARVLLFSMPRAATLIPPASSRRRYSFDLEHCSEVAHTRHVDSSFVGCSLLRVLVSSSRRLRLAFFSTTTYSRASHSSANKSPTSILDSFAWNEVQAVCSKLSGPSPRRSVANVCILNVLRDHANMPA